MTIYSHLAQGLISKLSAIGPEYGLLELSYPSFTRHFGFHCAPISAADAVEALHALLDVAGGVRLEIEVEGARNGGEWFGGGRVWESADGDGRVVSSDAAKAVPHQGDEEKETNGHRR